MASIREGASVAQVSGPGSACLTAASQEGILAAYERVYTTLLPRRLRRSAAKMGAKAWTV